jgi:hypothetical protein
MSMTKRKEGERLTELLSEHNEHNISHGTLSLGWCWFKTNRVRAVCGVGESSDEAGGDVMWRFEL